MSTTRKLNAVVTGTAGFIGSTLAERLVAEGHEVVGVDCLTPYYDVAAKTYTDTGVDMPAPISNYGIAALNDPTGLGFYIFGGRDPNGNIITTVRIGNVTGRPHYEGASFVPTAASIAGTQSMTSTVPTGPAGLDATTLAGGAALIVAVVVLAVYFVSRRGSK